METSATVSTGATYWLSLEVGAAKRLTLVGGPSGLTPTT